MATKKRPTAREATKHRILLRSRRVVRECDEMIRSIEYWNSINPSRKPIDTDDFRSMRASAQSVVDQFAKRK